MANLSQTPANVKPVTSGGNPSQTRKVVWGATIAQGNPVYRDDADGKWKLADNNVSALLAGSKGFGVALTAGSDGQPGLVHVGGDINLGGTLVVGETYALSATAGALCPIADVVTTNFATVLGNALDVATLRMPATGAVVGGLKP
jgi:hypothetical protein